MIGYCICGSFCTHAASLAVLRKLINKTDIVPIMSYTAYSTDTRFGTAKEMVESVNDICKRPVIHTIKDAEPLGPKIALDAMIILPCTGNTLAKIAGGITDTPVTMAAKAHLRCGRPLIIALASNDAMAANLQNIAALINRKNVYFVPMIQDDIINKPNSLVADFSLAEKTLESAMRGVQARPIFLTKQ